MYTVWLFLHLTGVSIGAGTGIYLMAMPRYADKNLEQAEVRTLLPGMAGALSRVGNAGLALLMVSGLMMISTQSVTGIAAAFWVKMLLVAAIVIYVATMKHWAGRVRTMGDTAAARRMKKVGVIGPPLGVLTILTAVLAFN